MTFRRIYSLLPIAVLGLLSAICSYNTKTVLFFASHDGEYMLMRSLVAAKALSFREFPIHWSQSLNHYCGVPVFKFFYPLWHWLAASGSVLLNVPLVSVVTTMYALTFFVSSLGMYGWLRSERLTVWASFAGAVLYLLAPYRMLNVYVRGSVESFGYALLPVVLWTFSLYYKNHQSHFRLLIASLMFTAFSLSHNVVVFLALPLIAAYCIVQSVRSKNWISTAKLGLCALLLSGFFWFPALLDQSQTRLVDQKVDIEGNLLTIQQLIYSPWGYTYQAGVTDGSFPSGISFSIGAAQLIGVGLFAVTAFLTIQKHQQKGLRLISILLVFLGYLYLATQYSMPVWTIVPILHVIQFPFRLLGPLVFLAAVLAAIGISGLKNHRGQFLLAMFLAVLSWYSIRNYMRPNPVQDLSIFSALETHPLRLTSTGVSDEILSRNDRHACVSDEKIISLPIVSNIQRETTERTGTITFSSPQTVSTDFEVALSYFPEIYTFQLNGVPVSYTEGNGRVVVAKAMIREGENVLTWRISMSRIERLSVLLSVFTFGLLLCALGMQGITRFSKSGVL